MTLIELVIVIGILGVVFAAVYMFFTKGTQQFQFSRMQNELATSGRLALEVISDEIIWAGYMPQGGWTEDQWHPVEVAADGSFNFYADFDEDKHLAESDHRNIFLDASNVLRITDDGLMNRVAGTSIVSLQFNYLNSSGQALSKPLSDSDRDAVRHIEVKITLQDSYMGDVYQTVLKTLITPRNLGVFHNFDPLFYLPPPLDAKIVVNVDGSAGLHAPTIDQSALVAQLDYWGFTLVQLSDDELEFYDYDSSGVDLVILRNITGTQSHIAIKDTLRVIPLPIIALDPDDAIEVFLMGSGRGENAGSMADMTEIHVDHPIHKNLVLDPTFTIYDTPSRITTLAALADSTDELITAVDDSTTSGVSVQNEADFARRRVHYCAPDFSQYSVEGRQFLLNVIMWNLPGVSPPPLGEQITTEGFEGASPGDVFMTLWEDNLEGGEMLPDSIPLYTDFEPGGPQGMIWVSSSTGSGAITRLGDNTLQMHRTLTGSFDRNVSASGVDLSAYSSLSDDLYITVDSWKGTSETINAEDGVFLFSAGGSTVELVSENFETIVTGNGDVEFWGDLYGRNRIHSPGWNNATAFVTLDSRLDGRNSRARMMIEVDTSALNDGTEITVSYRMTDHRDENNSYSATDNRGDYVGWSLGNDITDAVQGYQNLVPESKTNGVWSTYTYTFTPSGAMPDKLYIIFSHYDNDRAINATSNDGISFDDITITATDTSVSLDRIGIPADAANWQPVSVDLDAAAVANGVPFSSNFGIALSQYGLGSWATYGMHWRNFELGYIGEYYSLPGWSHGPVTAGGTDDWMLESVSGNYKWTLHSNFPAAYSNNTDCWLQTPQFSIPAQAVDPILSFVHTRDFESNYDFGWMEVSTNGGFTWQVLETDSYTHNYDGHRAYSGAYGSTTAEILLDSYVGQTIMLRFMFHSDVSVTRSGWTLDNFEATCTVSGISIESIGFKPTSPSGSWYFNQVDVWLGGVPESVFPGDGEWNKTQLTFAGTYAVAPPAIGDWSVIDLNQSFVLPASTNLLVKLEMGQTATSAGYSWVSAARSNMSRWAVSGSADPTMLTRADVRPALMISTATHGQRFVDADSSGSSLVMPLAFSSMYGDFEGLYLMTELGFSDGVAWVHGGSNDDWEIGAPLYIPDIDPSLLPRNQNNIAGNDLTDDGRYLPEAWNWIRSCPYPMAEVAAYDSVALSYDRCLRKAMNDNAMIQMAFTFTADPPLDSDWIIVKNCDYDDDVWVNDVVQLTTFFQDAAGDGKQYYFVRFLLDSGLFTEKGGWNIDNVGFYGRYAY